MGCRAGRRLKGVPLFCPVMKPRKMEKMTGIGSCTRLAGIRKKSLVNQESSTNINIPAIEDLPLLRSTLLQWYDKNARDLPWRKSRNHDSGHQGSTIDAYHVYVSEIMLQQTRVNTVP